MHRLRVYVDTSVFGGVGDARFAEASRRFFDGVKMGDIIALLSAETLREPAKAPTFVQETWQGLPPEGVDEVPITREVEELAEAYIRANVLGPASASDALHVATATVAGADLIVSWNFKHIVNFRRIRGHNSVNVAQGYRALTILSPLEIDNED